MITQYPKGLLKTIAELDISHAKLVVEKTRFSMLEKEIEDFLCNHPNITSVILFGVEVNTRVNTYLNAYFISFIIVMSVVRVLLAPLNFKFTLNKIYF